MPFDLSARGKQPRKQPDVKGPAKKSGQGQNQRSDLLWATAFGPVGRRPRTQKPKKEEFGDAADAADAGDIAEEFEPEATAAASAEPSSSSTSASTEVAMRHSAQVEFQAVEQALAVPLHVDLQQEEQEAAAEPAPPPSAPDAGRAQTPSRPQRLIGICGFDVAPARGSGSKCYLCSSSIAKGSLRFDYQFSVSGKMSRYIHPECCPMISEKGRENSLKFLRMHEASDIAGEQVRRAIQVLSSM